MGRMAKNVVHLCLSTRGPSATQKGWRWLEIARRQLWHVSKESSLCCIAQRFPG